MVTRERCASVLILVVAALVSGCGATAPAPPATDPVLAASPAVLAFGAGDAAQTLTIANTGASGLTWNVSADQTWITCAPESGSEGGTVTVNVERATLLAGEHTATVTVTSNGGTASINLTVTVEAREPTLAVDPTSLIFATSENSLTLAITNMGVAGLNWSVSADQDWVTLDPTSGTDNGGVTVTVDRTDLTEGANPAVISVTSNGGSVNVDVSVPLGGTGGVDMTVE